MPKLRNINPDPSERAASRGVTLNIRAQTLNIPAVPFPGMLPALTVQVVDQLRVRFAAGRPGHGPGEEQPHECQHGAGRQLAHPTGTAAACGESGGSEPRQSSPCPAETHPAPGGTASRVAPHSPAPPGTASALCQHGGAAASAPPPCGPMGALAPPAAAVIGGSRRR